jgi:glucose/mannose-6-phosphate isomerase
VNTPHGGGLSLAALRLDDPDMVEAGDPGGMLREVASSAAQVRTALRACAETDLSALRPDTRPRAIVVAGSGGSAFAGDALAAICGVSSPVQVLRVSGYQLPGWVGAADLVIAASRSGQTAEPVALATEATRRGCELVVVGAPGSPLHELAQRARGTFIPVDSGGPVRSTPWALTVPLLVVGSRLGVERVESDKYEAAAAAMEDICPASPRPASEDVRSSGKSSPARTPGRAAPESRAVAGGAEPPRPGSRSWLAARGLHRLRATRRYDQVATLDGPFVPAPEPEFPAAEDLTDAAFDEFSDDDADLDDDAADGPMLRLVLLADPAGEHPSVTRMRTAAVLLAEGRGAEVSEIAMDGDTPLLRLASAVQLLDYASVYLGIACGIDPLAIAAIKDLRDLAERSV